MSTMKMTPKQTKPSKIAKVAKYLKSKVRRIHLLQYSSKIFPGRKKKLENGPKCLKTLRFGKLIYYHLFLSNSFENWKYSCIWWYANPLDKVENFPSLKLQFKREPYSNENYLADAITDCLAHLNNRKLINFLVRDFRAFWSSFEHFFCSDQDQTFVKKKTTFSSNVYNFFLMLFDHSISIKVFR